MSSSSERKDAEHKAMMPTRAVTSVYENFMREMERMMTRPWTLPMDWEFPSVFEARDMRMALYELADRGDRYELQVEVPGIEKEKIDVKATKYSVEISGKHSDERGKGEEICIHRKDVQVVLSECPVARGDSSLEGCSQGRKWDPES